MGEVLLKMIYVPVYLRLEEMGEIRLNMLKLHNDLVFLYL